MGEALHRRLKSRAALGGLSLPDDALAEIRHTAERPAPEEMRARLEGRVSVTPPVSPAEAVRSERDRR